MSLKAMEPTYKGYAKKWQGTDGFRITVNDGVSRFMLKKKYDRYALQTSVCFKLQT
jgi:hypothetical protein